MGVHGFKKRTWNVQGQAEQGPCSSKGKRLMVTAEQKKCTMCSSKKPKSDFYRNRSRPDGYGSQCKTCAARYSQSSAGKAAVRRYSKSEAGRRARKQRRQTSEGKARLSARHARYRKRHPNRRKAREAVHYAIRIGQLQLVSVQTCADCPNPATAHHHYLGYEKQHWLDVIPLCRNCHRTRHQESVTA